MSPPSSPPENKPNKKKCLKKRTAWYLLQAAFLPLLFFDTEDGADMFLRKVG
jgi:hypothetical protein